MVVVWFKRDLRLYDHEPMAAAIGNGEPILLLFAFEPLWLDDPHYSNRHVDFIKQSLADLQCQLAYFDTKILVVEQNAIEIFEALHSKNPITHIFSYQETGMQITYERDKQVAQWSKHNGVCWQEFVQNGVLRGIKNRKNWKEHWLLHMNAPLVNPNYPKGNFLKTFQINELENVLNAYVDLKTQASPFVQQGGVIIATRYLKSFYTKRIKGYNKNYSKPLTSRLHSSRLSPYLAWGNLSVRQVIAEAVLVKEKVSKKELNSFLSRLRWQAHFIQKFEMEGSMEFKSVNKGYQQIKKEIKPSWQWAWQMGQTGIPMVDAAMRCLLTTGFINFRLRAMLASFFTHILWQPWQHCSAHLAQNFLDFEPGIHFPQLNMQSGETGINTIRIYNPIKNGKEHDPEGIFIKKWLPELKNVPTSYIHEPWKMPPLEQGFNAFRLGEDYPTPIVDIEKARKKAAEILYGLKKEVNTTDENRRIIKQHTLPNRPVWDKHF